MERINSTTDEVRKIELKTPKGTRDFGPEQMAVREKVMNIVVETFKRHGAVTIDTPVFELKDILTGKYGDEGAKLIYDLADQGGELCSLRYDLTVPFARYLAANKIEKIKRYHIAKVYRRDQPVMTKGRYREFYQCDFDIAGPGELMLQETECLKIADEVLSALAVGEFEIRVNHRLLLEGMFMASGIPISSFRAVCSSVDKLDKMPWEEIRNELIKEKGIDEQAIDKLGEFVQLLDVHKDWTNKDLLDYLYKEYVEGCTTTPGSENIAKAVEELRVLSEYSELVGFSKHMVFFPSLARGLDYYTGVIYEVVLKDFSFNTEASNKKQSLEGKDKAKRVVEGKDNANENPESSGNLGSVAAGGRYDKLVGMFMTSGKGKGTDVPCVGISFGIERLFTIMELKSRASQNNENGLRVSPTNVYVASAKQGGGDKNALMKKRIQLCAQLWDAGLRAEMSYKANPKVLEQFQYCEKNNIPLIILFGGEELEKNSVKVRDVETREEQLVSLDSLIAVLQKKINQKSQN